MPTWNWAESSGSSLEEQPRVSESRFGDGYSQRAPDGLNPIAQEWGLQFRECGDLEADQMIAFLRARGGVESFDWTPLWAATPIKVICPRWSRTQGERTGESDISATFRQVFEP